MDLRVLGPYPLKSDPGDDVSHLVSVDPPNAVDTVHNVVTARGMDFAVAAT